MTTWANQPENGSGGGEFKLLIDDTYFFNIDDTYQFLIDDGGLSVNWSNQSKS